MIKWSARKREFGPTHPHTTVKSFSTPNHLTLCVLRSHCGEELLQRSSSSFLGCRRETTDDLGEEREQCSSNWCYAKTLQGTQDVHRFKVLHFLPSSYLNRICLKVYFCQQPMLTSLIHLLLTRAIFQISVSRISCAILAIGLCLCFVLIFHLYQLKFQSTSTADTNAKHSAESKLHCVSCHTRGKKWDSGEEFTRSRLPDLAAANSGTVTSVTFHTFSPLPFGLPGCHTPSSTVLPLAGNSYLVYRE